MREKGTGNIYQKPDGTWIGRLSTGRDSDGKRTSKYFSGKTEAEVKRKIREFNKASGKEVKTKPVSLDTYFQNWLVTYKKSTLKPSSYDRLENAYRVHASPEIGMLQIGQVAPDDIQKLINGMKDAGFAYGTIKRTYDSLNAVFKHATIHDDIVKNPMLLVEMPKQKLFETKEIRYFTHEEAAKIVEECQRVYTTGAPVYIYGDVFILMLNTGMRMSEAIAIQKADWDQEAKTLHVRRNIQSVKKRDADGERQGGYQLVYNTTKTYSGDRVIPLNKTATEALERISQKSTDPVLLVCNSNGKIIPPDHVERTFYRILKNIGIEKTGTHSLRHTFASFLFEKGVDIKTVSKLLGHASIQITLNTYVHLIEKINHKAVETLDDLF